MNVRESKLVNRGSDKIKQREAAFALGNADNGSTAPNFNDVTM